MGAAGLLLPRLGDVIEGDDDGVHRGAPQERLQAPQARDGDVGEGLPGPGDVEIVVRNDPEQVVDLIEDVPVLAGQALTRIIKNG